MQNNDLGSYSIFWKIFLESLIISFCSWFLFNSYKDDWGPFFDFVSCVVTDRWAPLSQEAVWSWPPRMTTVSFVMPPSAPRLWRRPTIRARITPRGCDSQKRRVTHSRRYCHFLWGQSVMWNCVVRKRVEKDVCLEVSFFLHLFSSRESPEVGQRRNRKEGNDFKMMPNRRNMYTVQNSSGILCISTHLAYLLHLVCLLKQLSVMVLGRPENWEPGVVLFWVGLVAFRLISAHVLFVSYLVYYLPWFYIILCILDCLCLFWYLPAQKCKCYKNGVFGFKLHCVQFPFLGGKTKKVHCSAF